MRILFVTGSYYPRASANGVCIKRIRDALADIGICSDVICSSESSFEPVLDEIGKIHCIDLPEKTGRHGRLFLLMAKLRHAALWPVKTPETIRAYRRKIDELCSTEHYDAIVAALRPIPGAFASVQSGQRTILYELDSISNNSDNEHPYQRMLKHRVYALERYLYRNAANIFHMECHRQHYSAKRYEQYREKTDYLDIPQMTDTKISSPISATDEKKETVLIYTGNLLSGMRSPVELINILIELEKLVTLPVRCDFYSTGNCEGILSEMEEKTNGLIRRCGYVDLETLEQAIEGSDFLVSIGNTLKGKVTSLPSKVISYMATGKPIIHIHGGKNDSAIPYLQKYGLALILNPKDSRKTNAEKLMEFLDLHSKTRLKYDDVRSMFIKNTPEYSASRIKQAIEERLKANG